VNNRVWTMTLTTMVKCCGFAGVNNINGCPSPMGREGCVRPYKHKSCPPSVGTGDVKTHRCRCPPWRCHRGESTFPCSRHDLAEVFWRKPRFQVGSVRWWHPQHRHFVGSIVFGDMTWRLMLHSSGVTDVEGRSSGALCAPSPTSPR
jgi:hypothetical protein